MNEIPEFRQYRGDGTTRDGREAETPMEEGIYLAPPDLAAAVNAAIAVEQPLLVTGDPGTGKTTLAYSIAAELELGKVEIFPVRSDHQGRDLLYEIDNLQRFYDAQVGNPKAKDRAHYLRLGALGRAFQSEKKKVVLIDEIDKAPRDFPNDLLHVLDRMEIPIPELEIFAPARHRPIVVITSNRESQLPEPFLRRCLFYHIEFPERRDLLCILESRLRSLKLTALLQERIVDRFLDLRKVEGLLKAPATGEMLTWARVLAAAGVPAEELAGDWRGLPHLSAVFKNLDDFRRARPSVL